MAQRNGYNAMSIDMSEPQSNSLIMYGHTFDTIMNSSGLNILNNQDQTIYGSFGNSLIQGESSNLRGGDDGMNIDRISDSYPLGIRQNESSIPWDQLYVDPNQETMAHGGYGHYMEGMPLSAASFSTMLAYRGIPRSTNSIDDSNQSNSSTQNSMIWGHQQHHENLVSSSKHETMERTGLDSFGSMVNIDPNGWMISSQDTNFRGPDCTVGLPMLNQELSLSLATANPTSIQNQYSEMCCSSSQYNGQTTSCSKNQSWRYSSNFGSNYVQALQEILAALASYSIGNFDQINNYPTTNYGAEDQTNPSLSLVDSDDARDEERSSDIVQRVPHGSGLERKKKRLLALLQEVDKQYNQYQDEIHTVVSAFHSVTELNPHVHARFALQTISRLYRSLRERISNHILAMGPNFGREPTRMEKSFESSFIQRQWAIQQLRQRDNNLFRPQRGLPERSVSVLRAWMFQNFLHPYPKDAEKHLLAVKSGLSRSQVSNWFINARVRIWKPMIDEMYAEMNKRRSCENDEETNENQTRSHVTALDYAHY